MTAMPVPPMVAILLPDAPIVELEAVAPAILNAMMTMYALPMPA